MHIFKEHLEFDICRNTPTNKNMAFMIFHSSQVNGIQFNRLLCKVYCLYITDPV